MLDAAAITVVVSTDRDAPTLGEVVVALARQDAGARVVRDETIAAARNRALAECHTEVVAYVDDDVVVPDGWLAALRRAWAAAEADVGAIGGPIAGVRATVDYGDAPLELDAAERTLLAGNLSFRAEALRGVQGFWPMRGRAGVRDWFTEEHHAQR